MSTADQVDVAALTRLIYDENADNKVREQSIYTLGAHFSKKHMTKDLTDLLRYIRPFALSIPKARTSKLVRTLLELIGEIPNTIPQQVVLCEECIEWAKQEKRTFLRQRVEFRLATCYLAVKEYTKAIALTDELSRELRKIDDKALLLEVQLLESQIYFALQDLPKAKASLTSARTTANAIYCPPKLQADIDTQSGIILAAEKDFNTAFSYFFEAFEAKHTLESPDAAQALKYMLLCKVMNGKAGDVTTVANSKNAARYSGNQIDAMRAVAASFIARSIHQFEDALATYPSELRNDEIVFSHLQNLYDTLLVQNLSRLIEPFSRVEIAHVAHLINLPIGHVEQKLSQMILDKRLDGILDQGAGNLIIFDKQSSDKTYETGLDTIKALGGVVDSLFERVAALS